MIQTTKPRARPGVMFPLDGRDAQMKPVWLVWFRDGNHSFVHPSLDTALTMAFDWRITAAVQPKSKVRA